MSAFSFEDPWITGVRVAPGEVVTDRSGKGAMVGVVGAHPAGSEHLFEVRGFPTGVDIFEDPVTGSLNASVAQWLIRTGAAPPSYTATQGGRLGRAGVVRIGSSADGTVWVGGHCTTCISGTVLL